MASRKTSHRSFAKTLRDKTKTSEVEARAKRKATKKTTATKAPPGRSLTATAKAPKGVGREEHVSRSPGESPGLPRIRRAVKKKPATKKATRGKGRQATRAQKKKIAGAAAES